MSFSMFGVPSPTDPPAPMSFYDAKHAFAKQFLPRTDGSLRCKPLEFKGEMRSLALIWLDGYLACRLMGEEMDARNLRSLLEHNPQGVHIWVGDWMDGPYGDTVDPEPDNDSQDVPQ